MASAVFVRMFVSLQRKHSVGCSEGLCSKQLLDGCSSTDTSSWALAEREQGENVCTNDNSQMIVGEGRVWKLRCCFLHCTAKAEVTNTSFSYSNCNLLFCSGRWCCWQEEQHCSGVEFTDICKSFGVCCPKEGWLSVLLWCYRNCLIHRAPVQPWANNSTFLSPIFFTVKVGVFCGFGFFFLKWGRQRI